MSGNRKAPSPMVLVIDDENVVREMLKRYFASRGYQVLVAESGEQGLSLLESVRPDVILLDLHMPGKGGIEVLREMRLAHKDMPVIVLTAVSDPQIAKLAVSSGATDYLTKPISLPALKKVLATHLLLAS